MKKNQLSVKTQQLTQISMALRKRRQQKKRKITEQEICECMTGKACAMAAKSAKKLKSQAVSGCDNRFWDPNLTEMFVWRKKIQRDVSEGASLHCFSLKAEEQRCRERMAELEKLQKQRDQRALEKAGREDEMALWARERARLEFGDQQKKEEAFQFHQSRLRSVIRMRQGRTKPIDVLLKHLNQLDDLAVVLEEPLSVFKGLTMEELKELRDDITMHVDMDRLAQTHIDYWEALMVVCNWELAEAQRKDAEERGLHCSIETDVRNLLEGKSSGELEALQTEIESQMRSGAAKVVEYWEAVLNRLHLYKAKARLREIHANHLQLLQLQEDPSRPIDPEDADTLSPKLLHVDDNEEAIDPEEDRATLQRQRISVREKHQRRIQEAMEEGGAVFGSGDEVILGSQVYWWHNKYRPRKPKYMNRVHSGYEWNKYNRTHYDHDNPPPKTVQGYKFNIFYPDLVDNSKAPTYAIHKDGNNDDTCIIRFHGGPPYEDVAFRIVNKEWEYSHKMGFKCTFERGILHLHFNFKRFPYRR